MDLPSDNFLIHSFFWFCLFVEVACHLLLAIAVFEAERNNF